MTTLAINLNSVSSTRPLVLLPPFPLDSRVWDAVVARLNGCAITVDPPGFGRSSMPQEASMTAYARALLASLDAAGVDRFALAGNSMGGYAALAVAEIAPERLTGIALLGTKASADNETARAGRGEMIDKVRAGKSAYELVGSMVDTHISPKTKQFSSGVAAEFEGWLASAPTAGIAWAQRAMSARPDRLEVLRALDVPGVVMHGRDDTLMTQADMADLADALGVELQIVDCGHMIPLEAPDAVADALRRFL